MNAPAASPVDISEVYWHLRRLVLGSIAETLAWKNKKPQKRVITHNLVQIILLDMVIFVQLEPSDLPTTNYQQTVVINEFSFGERGNP